MIKYFYLMIHLFKILVLVMFSGCEKKPLDLESGIIQKDEVYYNKRTHNPHSGEIISLFKSQNKKISGMLSKGKKDGVWQEWYDNGNMKSQEGYSEGIPDGLWI